MNWTEPTPPTKGISYYDHVIAITPLGKFMIEWKSWKEFDSYSITLEDNYVADEYSLEDAKERVKTYLTMKRDELTLYLLK